MSTPSLLPQAVVMSRNFVAMGPATRISKRCPWTPEEERLLVEAVTKETPGCIDWHRVASALPPNRNNKDARKRWVCMRDRATSSSGAWTDEEDERLRHAIAKNGPQWMQVAKEVRTRNSEQCSKRWHDVLDPTICRSPWTPEEDERLLNLVRAVGRHWSRIAHEHFGRRTGLSLKNRSVE
ncbi:hypothetical protein IE81DRAFT_312015 [Ceraceosorus guamensis]|uniref:Homeodomain-like protein n=1 Tax=Ceraceosorus guamensis TaxID=1522189 RepID=A0A316W1D3_9BASI|nr:hypothetical protein IE81DRAFT_312015 [Ceraceosorus guamensis]PWN43489.1 hypothetical protein IE81DRAFT_312015 [Ceraceosorus guamensis]